MELSTLINDVRRITRDQSLVGMTWFRTDNKTEPGIVPLSALRLAAVYAVNGGLRFNTYRGYYQYDKWSRLELMSKNVINQFELTSAPAGVPAFPQTHPGMSRTCGEILLAMQAAADQRVTSLPLMPVLPEIYLGSCPRNPLAPEFGNEWLLRACADMHPGETPTHALQASVFHKYVTQAEDGRTVYPANLFVRKSSAYQQCPVTGMPRPTVVLPNGSGLGSWFVDENEWRPRRQPMVGAYADLSVLCTAGNLRYSPGLQDVCSITDIDITDYDGLTCLQHLLGAARTGAFSLWRKYGMTERAAVAELDSDEVVRVSRLLQTPSDTRLATMLAEMRQLLNSDAADDVTLDIVATDLDIVKVLLDPRNPLPAYTQIMSAYAKASKLYSDAAAWEQFTADVEAVGADAGPVGIQAQVVRLTAPPCMESMYWTDLTSKIGLYVAAPNNVSSTQKSKSHTIGSKTHA